MQASANPKSGLGEAISGFARGDSGSQQDTW
jgi:hypothetical protein